MIVAIPFQADHPQYPTMPRAAITIASVRKFIPEAKIIQITNLSFPGFDGVDEVVRLENTGDFIDWVTRGFIAVMQRGEPVLHIGTDVVIKAPVSDVFDDDFDVAASLYPLRDRTDGAYCGDVEFTKPSGLEFWQDVLEYYRNTPAIQDGWEGGQTAFLEVVKRNRYTVKPLEFDTYCYTPEALGEDVSAAKVLHFRGPRKWMMAEYARNEGFCD